METKIVKTIIVLLLLIGVLTVLSGWFSKLSSTPGQWGLVALMLMTLFVSYKLIKNIFKKT